jgi:hypothetical protein
MAIGQLTTSSSAQPENGGHVKGEPILDCVRTEPPALSEIVGLLNCSGGESDVLAVWAKTAVEKRSPVLLLS